VEFYAAMAAIYIYTFIQKAEHLFVHREKKEFKFVILHCTCALANYSLGEKKLAEGIGWNFILKLKRERKLISGLIVGELRTGKETVSVQSLSKIRYKLC